MTRREKIVSELGLNKIVQESIKRHPRFADKRVGFIDGAEWMQKTMMEKATQWLFENVYDYLNPEDQERVESFRKYLEE